MKATLVLRPECWEGLNQAKGSVCTEGRGCAKAQCGRKGNVFEKLKGKNEEDSRDVKMGLQRVKPGRSS